MTKPRLKTFTHSSSVSFGRPDLVHPRLQLVSRATVHPANSTNTQIQIRTYLQIFIPRNDSRDQINQIVTAAINQNSSLLSYIENLEEAQSGLRRANDANDQYMILRDEGFGRELESYLRENANLARIKGTDLKLSEHRRLERRMEKLKQRRQQLDETLNKRSKSQGDLPHPFNDRDRKVEGDGVSIGNLIKEVQRAKAELDRAISAQMRSVNGLDPIISGYLFHHLQTTLPTEAYRRLIRAYAANHCTILELETLEEAEASIQTNRYGLPVDADEAPVEIEMQAILQAIENDNVVLEEGNFAFIPNTPNASALIGKIDRGHMNLVLIPPDVMHGIIAFEEQWYETLQTLIRSAYQSPAPGQGVSPQEQQEPVEDASGNPPDDELELIPVPPQGSTEHESSSDDQSDERLPHFPTIHD